MVCILALALPIVTGADFGDFSGSTDFGSGWDSGSSWGSSDWSFGSDWGSGNSSYGGYGSYGGGTYVAPVIISDSPSASGGEMISFLFTALFLFIVFIMLIRFFRKIHGPATSSVQGAQLTPQNALTDMAQYHELDPHFDQSALEEKLSNVYIQMQQCWQNKNLEPLRPYLSDAYYAQAQRQLKGLIDNGKTNHIDHPTVLSANCRGFFQQDGMDHIITLLRSRIIDYVVDDKTGNLISGSKTRELFMVYEMELVRKTGLKTVSASDTTTVNCPNCGAPLNINATAQCPYCGSIVTVEDHGWVITKIKGISQTSAQ